MELKEKILLFKFAIAVIWTLKQIVLHSRIQEYEKEKIASRLTDIAKPLADYINELYQKDEQT